jgi:hypothetical protein
VQLLAAYGASLDDFADKEGLVEVIAYSVFLELDNALDSLLARCRELGMDINGTLSQGAPSAPLPVSDKWPAKESFHFWVV